MKIEIDIQPTGNEPIRFGNEDQLVQQILEMTMESVKVDADVEILLL